MMNLQSVFFLIMILLVGCSSYSEELTKTGEITKIDEKLVYVDEEPFNVGKTAHLHVGQKVKVTFIDTTSEDVWDPDDFYIKSIEKLD
ncbi:hypothetical protein [Gracilibacillus salinarum]|uniref:DUF3221 domain-containing protein n=1 Tax=Gracilibacillus salinarum TaxID=2932255 RepID=A0ABY4GH40_9BACI|nr:hypothetical protein [Gracilibacillus salinarum]UOQ83466.1 hypothetical protein MUN87_11905 [Gracilibacillus salinarum]